MDEIKKENRNLRQRQARKARMSERILKNGRWFHPRAAHGTTTGYAYYGCRCRNCTFVYKINK